jgi:putative selenate reductase
MSDKFAPCSVEKMLQWILAEEAHGQIFGIPKTLFFVPRSTDVFRMTRYGELLETPVGVAAGPHTQLAQNIISAWLTGARYIELKTVQTLDELEVTRPCIDMTDEGYNCEWSQELKLDQSYDQYLNAWILLHVLKAHFGWGDPGQRGFIFNMSVGYNMEGILNANVQRFLAKMADCAAEKTAKLEELRQIHPQAAKLDIPDCISDNITISTMHGCPPDEIEKIGRYFIQERRLNTTIKLNPTLLGAARLRQILNSELGFDIEVPDEAFAHDLKYDAGVALIQSLLDSAEKAGVAFNLKLSNTLETANLDQNLPPNEKMVYMSGRALHPITVNLARRLQTEFGGRLDISFSAGVDCFNISEVLACNLGPVTVCSDLLKPGGYGRIGQYLDEIRNRFAAAGADSIEDYISAVGKGRDIHKAALTNLQSYAAEVVAGDAYRKARFPYENIKTHRELTTFDCIGAPCVTTCPAGQDIPAYMHYTAAGDYRRAWEVILETNPFPNMQGMVCDHLCQFKCTRMNYDSPLLIREIKRFVAQRQGQAQPTVPDTVKGSKVAIIGAGPSGLSCGYFLRLAGFEVDIFECKDRAGGMAADGIPIFRLDDASLKTDIDGILATGVRIHYGSRIDQARFEDLRADYSCVYIAIGAQAGMELGIPGEDAPGVYDQLSFLSAVRKGHPPDLGRDVVVIGGGNSAMDAARTAKRLVGPDGSVRIVYRRTRKEMPADTEEIKAALEEGVELVELTAPECLLVENGRVISNVCFRMKLGEKDASGRRRPIKIEGTEFELQADTVISAIGQRVELDFLPEPELKINPDSLETVLDNVFAGGDAVRGASTLIRAIADGKRAAESIIQKDAGRHRIEAGRGERRLDVTKLQIKQARRLFGPGVPEPASGNRTGFEVVTRTLTEEAALREADRCLQCDLICNVCTTVCPNRANIAYRMNPVAYTLQRAVRCDKSVRIENLESARIEQSFQIINIGDFCNECGNCSTFCPTSGAPYRIKPKFFLNARSFYAEQNGYRFDGGVLEARVAGRMQTLRRENGPLLYETEDIRARLNPETLAAESVEFVSGLREPVSLQHAAKMGVLMHSLVDFYLFKQ